MGSEGTVSEKIGEISRRVVEIETEMIRDQERGRDAIRATRLEYELYVDVLRWIVQGCPTTSAEARDACQMALCARWLSFQRRL